MKRTRINPYSEKRVTQMQAEVPIRIALCKRAGGTPITREIFIYRKGKKFIATKVVCMGGKCECNLENCPKYPSDGQHLEPHEVKTRARGGMLSLDNSLMVLRGCHKILQRSEPVWSSKDV